MTSYSFVTTYKDSLLNQDFDYEEVCKESFESLHCHETDEKDDHYHWKVDKVTKFSDLCDWSSIA